MKNIKRFINLILCIFLLFPHGLPSSPIAVEIAYSIATITTQALVAYLNQKTFSTQNILPIILTPPVNTNLNLAPYQGVVVFNTEVVQPHQQYFDMRPMLNSMQKNKFQITIDASSLKPQVQPEVKQETAVLAQPATPRISKNKESVAEQVESIQQEKVQQSIDCSQINSIPVTITYELPNRAFKLPDNMHFDVSFVDAKNMHSVPSYQQIVEILHHNLQAELQRQNSIYLFLENIESSIKMFMHICSEISHQERLAAILRLCQTINALPACSTKQILTSLLNKITAFYFSPKGQFKFNARTDLGYELVAYDLKQLSNDKYLTSVMQHKKFDKRYLFEGTQKNTVSYNNILYNFSKANPHSFKSYYQRQQNNPTSIVISEYPESLDYHIVLNSYNSNYVKAIDLLRQGKVEEASFIMQHFPSQSAYTQHFNQHYHTIVFNEYGIRREYEVDPAWRNLTIEEKNCIKYFKQQEAFNNQFEVRKQQKNLLQEELLISSIEARTAVINDTLYTLNILPNEQARLEFLVKLALNDKEVFKTFFTNTGILKKYQHLPLAQQFNFSQSCSEKLLITSNTLLSLDLTTMNTEVVQKIINLLNNASTTSSAESATISTTLAEALTLSLKTGDTLTNLLSEELLSSFLENPSVQLDETLNKEIFALTKELYKKQNCNENGICNEYQGCIGANEFILNEQKPLHKNKEMVNLLNDLYALRDQQSDKIVTRAVRYALHAHNTTNAKEACTYQTLSEGLLKALQNNANYTFLLYESPLIDYKTPTPKHIVEAHKVAEKLEALKKPSILLYTQYHHAYQFDDFAPYISDYPLLDGAAPIESEEIESKSCVPELPTSEEEKVGACEPSSKNVLLKDQHDAPDTDKFNPENQPSCNNATQELPPLTDDTVAEPNSEPAIIDAVIEELDGVNDPASIIPAVETILVNNGLQRAANISQAAQEYYLRGERLIDKVQLWNTEVFEDSYFTEEMLKAIAELQEFIDQELPIILKKVKFDKFCEENNISSVDWDHVFFGEVYLYEGHWKVAGFHIDKNSLFETLGLYKIHFPTTLKSNAIKGKLFVGNAQKDAYHTFFPLQWSIEEILIETMKAYKNPIIRKGNNLTGKNDVRIGFYIGSRCKIITFYIMD